MIQNLFDKPEENSTEKSEENNSPDAQISKAASFDDILLEIPDFEEEEIERRIAELGAPEDESTNFPVLAEISALPADKPFNIYSSNELAKFDALEEKSDFADPFDSSEPAVATAPESSGVIRANDVPLLFQSQMPAEPSAETARKSGLAWAAAIALFGSVVFCLVIGWFADLLLGTSPWGIVGGIVLGSIVGFAQFFRMTSQILKK